MSINSFYICRICSYVNETPYRITYGDYEREADELKSLLCDHESSYHHNQCIPRIDDMIQNHENNIDRFYNKQCYPGTKKEVDMEYEIKCISKLYKILDKDWVQLMHRKEYEQIIKIGSK